MKDTMRAERKLSRSFAGVTFRTFGASVALAAAIAGESSLPALATSHGSSGQTEVIDPGTGFLVCRSFATGSSGPSWYQQIGQCIGRCVNGNFTNYYRRRRDEPSSFDYYRRLRRQPPSYNCTDVGSCVRSPSNGCNWVGVDFSESRSSGVPTYSLKCRGPTNGTCTWYSDPFCTAVISPGRPPREGGGVACDPAGNWGNGTWCQDAVDYLVDQRKPASCPDVTEQQNLGPPWFGPWSCIRSCSDGGLYLPVRRANDSVVCLGTYDYPPEPAACSFYTDANCTVLAPGSREPNTSPYKDETGGVKCNQTAAGWCKVGADVVLLNQTSPTECLTTTTAPPTPTGTTATASATATPTPAPWTCVTSCPDKAHAVLARLTPSKDGVQCQGPNATMCSWYADGTCTKLAPGEPMPADDGLQGYVCAQTAEGWCGEAWRVLNGGATSACTSATATGTSTTVATASATGTGSTPLPTSTNRPSAAIPLGRSSVIPIFASMIISFLLF
ncbi:hypothetical protein DFJ74DRAFT_58544 [Hyaloraphidium curvatum]|nr:hypothetical protein DFJ74DRAFT_58544 [Hyaloraphidium curvatum]